MKNNDLNAEVYRKRSEEIQDIVERMPTKFGLIVASVVLGLFLLLLCAGYCISYPDTVQGQIVINTRFSPVKLVANTSGKLTLTKYRANGRVKTGDYIAYIQNSANVDDIRQIDRLLSKFDVHSPKLAACYPLFPSRSSLGEINTKYAAFLNALQQYYNYERKNVYQQQQQSLNNEIRQLRELLVNNTGLMQTKQHNMMLSKKMADRDSILLSEKAVDEDDADHSKVTYLNSKESFQAVKNELITAKEQISNDEGKLEELDVQQSDKEKEMRLDILSSFNDLKDNIKAWEEKYVFKATVDGRLDFSKFWSNDQFVQAGEEVFSVIPVDNRIIGQMELPAHGAGKVKPGQTVIIKLDNYPFEEYGSVKGKVRSISLMTNTVKTSNQTPVDMYLLEVDLPDGLVSHFGSKLGFKTQLKGSADVISSEKRLIERFFDNLTYISDKDKS
ncbi:HlyD family efflux transporter periplasmic adaptor subunit [Mucilaginibacter sp. SMC90]|uniref:HlyD family secretion protein n=1 Tax=Mucilaginibacter sp. SMC90 TaxID=2929803 RepID=UPI001FB2C34E|nr:HlyD family secretion protein [Mucilaginibacter sp. SMC90]UOE50917.1 HlyD family efflux transporter periplasmic adaptor subunit [Mucilaginibacter sp. SMC90]